MKINKFLLLPAIILSLLFTFSCTKKSDTELQKQTTEKTDTVTQKQPSTLDSMFDAIKPNEPDTSSLAPAEFRTRLNEVFYEYTDLKHALVNSDTTEAIMQTNQLKKSLTNVNDKILDEKLRKDWDEINVKIEKCCKAITSTENIAQQRKKFSEISGIIADLVKKFGLVNRTVYFLDCPDKKGIDWLVDTKDIANPYFGKADDQTDCAEVKEAWKFE